MRLRDLRSSIKAMMAADGEREEDEEDESESTRIRAEVPGKACARP